MKAKSSYSGVVAETAAKGALGVFAIVSAFIGGFVIWSAAGIGGAIVDFIRNF